jgi:hypothetical protein
MNWFQRHLNWSLFLAVFVLPSIIGGIFFIILFSVFYSAYSSMSAMGVEDPDIIIENLFYNSMSASVIYLFVWLAVTVFIFVAVWWYLGQKARSKWFMLLIFVPFGFIFLLLLENRAVGLGGDFVSHAIGYGGDFGSDPATDYWRPDTGQFSGYDSEQLKELDYSPAKNVKDIAYGGAVKDVGDAGVPGGEVPPPFPPRAPEETTPEVSAQVPLEVPGEAAPETRAELSPEVPPETTVEFSVEAVDEAPPEAPAEAKMAEEAVRYETLKMPILLDDAGVVIKCFYHPDDDAVNLCSRCGKYVCSQCNYVTGTHPICRNCWYGRAEAPVAPVSPEAKESPKLSESEKSKAEEDKRLHEFRQLYEEALPIISIVIKRGPDGSPSPPLELREGLKLRPILENAQKLPEPTGIELLEARKEFEQLLLSCIRVAEEAAEFVSSGEQTLPDEADLTRLSVDIAATNGLMQGLSQRLASISQSPGD